MKSSKAIDKMLKYYFFHSNLSDSFCHNYLCCIFNNSPYASMWDRFWMEINTQEYTFMYEYLKKKDLNTEKAALLRLLIVEDFKRYVQEKENENKKI